MTLLTISDIEQQAVELNETESSDKPNSESGDPSLSTELSIPELEITDNPNTDNNDVSSSTELF
ncbi:hypothetical protein BT96DRAFT_995160 [Gymnopus androsaceus JB14]|uniref:Uncharacterized protein n=1 Tax=Gymnopus androsaceus JB14 TaxID=1447944 RepID=A0A6A4HHX5_9AGAR|nr:hypothetical protein BT96DRAFT_995160 [Gymnopus androsaceus JB14]